MTQISDLPFELRSTIWMLTIEPRTVKIGFEIGRVPFGKKRRTTRLGCFVSLLTHAGASRTPYLASFSNVQEIYVVCLDWPEAWGYPEESLGWPCPRENVWLIHIHTETNDMVTVAEDYRRVEGYHEEARRQEAEEEALQRLELAGAANSD
ncbi:hypothetical protein V8C34DRAFT_132885 [Trichoderma compactum]